jgi:hypothetical protein
MPQLLNYLGIEDHRDSKATDWGVIAVYTCPNSCGDGEKSYFEEFGYCQPVTK